jgi:exopolysaccharide biosynthesis polyprenyl glycosylphosphotransferase
VSVSEREMDGFELVRMPAQPASSLDAFIDLRTEPDRRALAPATGAVAAPSADVSQVDARGFLRQYQQFAAGGDALCAAVAALIALAVRFGTWQHVSYDALTLAVPVLWVVLLAAKRGYEHRFLGRGPEEYRRVWEAGLLLFITTAVLSFSVKGDVARGYVTLVVPLTIALTAVYRTALRRWAARVRSRGLGVENVLVVGPDAEARSLFDRLRKGSVNGLRPVGIYPHDPDGGGLDGVLAAVDASSADMVAVVADPELSGQSLRELSWELEERHVDLVVDPGLVDVAGPRLSIHPVADLSLLHVHRTMPSSERLFVKAVFDRVLAVLLLLIASPALIAIAVAVKATSRGPVLFRQTRVGVDGHEFTLLKFRSMVTDADKLVDQLKGADDGNGVLFKMKKDPRVTCVGAFLRRYSFDELPQLINVVTGEMSLVGPRPPLPSEVAGYDDTAHRRLRLRPGLTGLWQVSGRSDLSWEDSLRLDLRYVDNWSMALDLQILVRTVRAVTHGAGAY